MFDVKLVKALILQITFSLYLQAVVINDQDIKRQEIRVQEARKKLETAMTSLRGAEVALN